MQTDGQLGTLPIVALVTKYCLKIDDRYQRRMSDHGSAGLVKRLVDEFAWHKFGALVCADNGDGTYMVIDGQHRLTAALAIDQIDKVPVVIIDAETLREQAKSFVGINKHRVKMNPLQIYHAECTAGDETALAMQRVLNASGCAIPRNIKLSDNMLPGETMSVAAVRQSVTRFGDQITTRALTILKRAYSESGGDIRSQMIHAVVSLINLETVEPKESTIAIDEDRLVAVIADRDADSWIEAGRTIVRQLGINKVPMGVRICIVTSYNQRLASAKRLPWDR